MKKWRIVGFNHPKQERSLIYKQDLNKNELHTALDEGITRGCNLFSIRGFEEDEEEQCQKEKGQQLKLGS